MPSPVKSKEIGERLRDIQEYLLEQYKQSRPEKERDWRTYEQRLAHRMREAVRSLEPLIEEAVKTLEVKRGRGRKPTLSLKQKLILVLLKELVGTSNRSMASMLALFSLLSGIDVSYKAVERLYSDPEVELAIHNLHVLILRKRGVHKVDASGDGTGYSLTISKHYASETQKRKDKAKTTGTTKGFVYSFKMLDLATKMYVCYGTSLRSEKEAFERAMDMLARTGVTIGSMRLDRYYSFPCYVDRFGEARVYIIPRKNSTLRGSWKWKRTMMRFVKETIPYLGQYYLRNNSEAGFSVDKRWFGWRVNQRREDRIDTAISCMNTWHNLFNLYTP